MPAPTGSPILAEDVRPVPFRCDRFGTPIDKGRAEAELSLAGDRDDELRSRTAAAADRIRGTWAQHPLCIDEIIRLGLTENQIKAIRQASQQT